MNPEKRDLKQKVREARRALSSAKKSLKKANKQYDIDNSWLYNNVRCFGVGKGCIQDKIVKEHRPVHGGGQFFVPFLKPFGVVGFIPIFHNYYSSSNTLVYRAGTKRCDNFKRKAKQLPQACESCEKYKQNYLNFIQSRDELQAAKEEFETCKETFEGAKQALKNYRTQRWINFRDKLLVK